MPVRPVGQALAVTLMTLILAGGVGLVACRPTQAPAPSPVAAPPSEVAPGPAPTPAPPTLTPKELGRGGPPPRPPLEMKATLAQAVLAPGQHVSITWSLKNVSAKPVTVRPFPPETTVSRMRIIEWPSGEDDLTGGGEIVRLFPGGSEELNLQSGETATHSLVWDQRNGAGWPVAPGYYELGVGVNVEGGWGMTNRARVLIQFPQGAIEKSIEVDQSRTASGITVTLKRVELSATGSKVYVFTTPPNYRLQKEVGNTGARYRADGQPLKLAGSSGIRFLEDGVELIWDQLDPIRSDAKMLTFTITVVGGRPGPWEFEIPLQ